MDTSQFEIPENLDAWIRIALDFGFLFLTGSLILFSAFCVFLIVDCQADAARRKRPPPEMSSTRAAPPEARTDARKHVWFP